MSDNNKNYMSEGLKEAIKKIGVPKIKLPEINSDSMSNHLIKNIASTNDFDWENFRNPTWDLVEKQEEANDLLGQIVENTSVLKEIVEINRKTLLNAEELSKVMQEINKVSIAKDKEEADTLFQNAIRVINNSGETAGNMANLISLLMGIYSTVNALIQK